MTDSDHQQAQIADEEGQRADERAWAAEKNGGAVDGEALDRWVKSLPLTEQIKIMRCNVRVAGNLRGCERVKWEFERQLDELEKQLSESTALTRR